VADLNAKQTEWIPRVMTAEDACDNCGAAVIDPQKHANWHKSNVPRSIIGGGMFDRG
jgi:hypothetical protein